jgi:hypothetical protein
MAINSESIQKLLPLLRPLMENENQRRGYLIRALGTDTPVLHNLALNTPTNDFIPNLLDKLIAFGEITPDKPAICALLEVIRADVGEDVKRLLDEQLQQIKDGLNRKKNLAMTNSHQITEEVTTFSSEQSFCGSSTNFILVNNDGNDRQLNDYSSLEELLKIGQWQEADKETKRILLKLFGKEEDKGLGVEEIRKLPCEVIRTIDDFWTTYSNGRFGLSVQKQIWQNVKSSKPQKISILSKLKNILGETEKEGDNDNSKNKWYCFGERVGWYKENNWVAYQNIASELTITTGSFPYCRGWWKGMRYQYEPQRFSELMLKFETCCVQS